MLGLKSPDEILTHFYCRGAHAPYVSGSTGTTLFDHLWSHPWNRTTYGHQALLQGGRAHISELFRTSEVRELRHTSVCDQHVRPFDVAVYYIAVVKVAYSLEYVTQKPPVGHNQSDVSSERQSLVCR